MSGIKKIRLPKAVVKGKISLEETIAKRRSQRTFFKRDLNLKQISQLLWAAQGISEKRVNLSLRTTPSAGALYPMEIYLLNREGLYRYAPEGNLLEILSNKDLRRRLADAALGQSSVAEAPVDIIICVVYPRITHRYKERGIRYALIEIGHIAQNIHLQAVALGLGSVPIGAFDEERAKRIIKAPNECEPLYIIPVGYPA